MTAAATTCIWLTGPRGAGTSTVARTVVEQLRARDCAVVAIDEVEGRLDPADPIAAVVWLAEALLAAGVIPIVAVDAPERAVRDRVREKLAGFAEVFVDGGTTDEAYEEPFAPELRVPTYDRDAMASAAQVVSWLETAGAVEPEVAVQPDS